ncbi:MAG: hypothetical protein M1838_001418 [Thelocarpon superellum]|nr:MAG: hypothetical protein M1838_001418 [Thelocarpon superellum]
MDPQPEPPPPLTFSSSAAAAVASQSTVPVRAASRVHKRPVTAVRSEKTAPDEDRVRPKQSKSRNGCITCKAKRLKCDETKPSCQQCHKRNVTCGGYKKAFKWRPLEEASFTSKPKKGSDGHSPPLADPGPSAAYPPGSLPTPPYTAAFPNMTFPAASTGPYMSNPPPASNPPTYSFEPQTMQAMPHVQVLPPISGPLIQPLDRSAESTPTLPTATTASSAPRSGQSPRLIDLLLPGTDMNAPPVEHQTYRAEQPAGVFAMVTPQHVPPVSTAGEEEDVEEIPRGPEFETALWPTRYTSTAFTASGRPHTLHTLINGIPPQPSISPGSPEQLMLRFDKQTCGILSIKDGPTENPWRTLVWPLAKDSPALYHALASLTAFHTSKEQPSLKLDGVEHMRQSVRALATNIGSMRIDAALATTLVLAFSESWDQHISTGIQHLRGAKLLVNQALVKHRTSRPMAGADLATLRFLVNTWIYMDVIARLTSIENDDFNDFDTFVSFGQGLYSIQPELDPLMGCASNLFPMIGRVANLIRRVRNSKGNSPSLIAQATTLKAQIEEWTVPDQFETPEDPTSEVDHSVHTAEAYRWATLLYLHQAVPEMPSLSSGQLAAKVLTLLSMVPLSSRAIIVHIYPLLAAGCEADDEETRRWVKYRWDAMARRMWIGNIDRCWEVIKEVWDRRDASRQPYGRALYEGPMNPDETVRGSLHWVGVMTDWHWEDRRT